MFQCCALKADKEICPTVNHHDSFTHHISFKRHANVRHKPKTNTITGPVTNNRKPEISKSKHQNEVDWKIK